MLCAPQEVLADTEGCVFGDVLSRFSYADLAKIKAFEATYEGWGRFKKLRADASSLPKDCLHSR